MRGVVVSMDVSWMAVKGRFRDVGMANRADVEGISRAGYGLGSCDSRGQ